MTESPADPVVLGAAAAARLIAARAMSSSEYVEALLARVAAREQTVSAWAFIDPEALRRAARRCDQEPAAGPLHGVPIGVKDVIDTADMPTRFNSPIYADRRPKNDAACVRRLRAAGAIIMGKLVTAEFAFMRPGPTRNPHDPSRTPGGSSSGSAAAVADAMVPAALATQTGGSTIRPAAFCGVIGYKPPFGAWDTTGLRHLAPSLDTLGLCARDLEDVALLSAVLSEDRSSALPCSAPPSLALWETPYAAAAEAAARDALHAAAEIVAQSGGRVRTLDAPLFCSELNAAHRVIMAAETARSFAAEWRDHRARLSDELAEFIAWGLRQTEDAIAAARAVAARSRRWLDSALAPEEVVLAPSVPGEAPVGLETTGNAIFNRLWTLLHATCLHLPTGLGPARLPIGVQLVDPRGREGPILSAAHWMVEALGSGSIPVTP